MKYVQKHFLSFLLLGGILQGSAEDTQYEVIRSLPTHPQPSTYPTLFSKIPAEKTNLDFINPIIEDHPMRRLYAGGFASGGVAIGDINGDSLPDVFLTNGPNPNKLYLQTKGLHFEDATNVANLANPQNPWSAGVAFFDIENDGDLDIFLCNYGSPNQVYINDGKGKFSEEGKKRGLGLKSASVMIYPADYDLDGDLDLYLVCNRLYRPNGRPQKPPFEMVQGKPIILPEYQKYFGFQQITEKTHKIVTIGRPDILFQNDGKGYYKDVTKAAGIEDIHRGLSATWYDYNHDNYPDLFVANDMNDVDQFYRNNKDGTFTDVTMEIVPHTTWFSMGADIADVNNDGRIDYLCVDMAGSNHYEEKINMGVMGQRKWFIENHRPTQYMWNTLFLNTGTEKMLDAAYMMGVAKSDWSWAPKFGDFDNDGWVDLFISNGMTRNLTHSDLPIEEQWLIGREEFDIFRKTPVKKDTNLAWRNNGSLKYDLVGKEWGLDHHGMTFSAATADINQDGNLDLITVNLEENIHLYRNNSSNTQNRVTLELRGTSSNRLGIGATVQIKTHNQTLTRYHNPFTGYMSSNEPILHFGLGREKEIKSVTIQWPNRSNTKQTIKGLKANQHYVIYEPRPQAGPMRPVKPKEHKAIFKQITLSAIRHTETPFDDYERQPLLPAKHSQLGPGVAVGDLENNGFPDLFIGGAANQPAYILIGQEDEQWRLKRPGALVLDKAFEDMGALFLDADGDGDQDLFVSSGSTENSNLQNRIYLNDGKGNLSKASDTIFQGDIPQSSSTAAACDYDRDGDLDIFTASRVVPAKYPISPKSFLLQNEGSEFVPSNNFPNQDAGMITSALWSDVDNDGWNDLLLTTEWGPIQFYKNEKGVLKNYTSKAGLEKLTGWWNGIAGGDLDNDGDMDYVVTNLGLNTKYMASTERPIFAYYGQFDDSGKSQYIEAQYEHDILFPLRGKSCSSLAMPHLSKKFKTYESFAKATLTQIYPTTRLSKAQRFETTTLESGILINNGKAQFEFKPLPRITQISPGYGVQICEINGDFHKDILIVQNFYPNQHETGRMDAGLGQLLMGKGNMAFAPVWPKESGITLAGDHTALATMDVNKDQKPDFLTTENNGLPKVLLNQSESPLQRFTLELIGKKGNPTAIGARVQIKTDATSPIQEFERRAGGSYLSQSISKLFCIAKNKAPIHSIQIRWPDGSQNILENVPYQSNLVIHQEKSGSLE